MTKTGYAELLKRPEWIGLLIPFEDSRNIYQINPEMIYTGRLK